MPINNANKTSYFRDALIITLLLAFFFGFMLGSRPLQNPDEGRYAEIPREMLATHNFVTPHIDGFKYFEKPPLVYWLSAASMKAFGQNTWSLRGVSAFFALLGCLGIYFAGRKLFNRRTGLLATTILASSFFYFLMAHVLTLDMTVSILMTMALLAFLLGQYRPPSKSRFCYFMLFYACMALAVLTKGLIGILLPGAIIFLWLLIYNEWHCLKKSYIISGGILFLLIALPWHILAQIHNPGFFQQYIINQQFLRFLTPIAKRTEPIWFYFPILFISFLPWIFFLAQTIKYNLPTSWKTRHEFKTSGFLFIWVVFIFIFFTISSSKMETYLLPIYPALALLTANFFDKKWGEISFYAKKAALLLFMGFFIAASIGLIYFANTTNVLEPGNNILLTSLAILIIVLAIIGWLIARRKHDTKTLFVAISCATILTSLFLIYSLKYLPNNSTVKLANIINKQIKPNNEVVVYNVYYQDLPFYLKRKVVIVEWQGEIAFGISRDKKSPYHITFKQLHHDWVGPTKIFLVIKKSDLDGLMKKNKDFKFHKLGEIDNQTFLITNKP